MFKAIVNIQYKDKANEIINLVNFDHADLANEAALDEIKCAIEDGENIVNYVIDVQKDGDVW